MSKVARLFLTLFILIALLSMACNIDKILAEATPTPAVRITIMVTEAPPTLTPIPTSQPHNQP
ncbi:MAG TPA: hypothetical protein ENJ56_08435 [Anaerolineae bacterium]|nr:hypothetical protein [Anaerolineae bacterium]